MHFQANSSSDLSEAKRLIGQNRQFQIAFLTGLAGGACWSRLVTELDFQLGS